MVCILELAGTRGFVFWFETEFVEISKVLQGNYEYSLFLGQNLFMSLRFLHA